MGGFIMTKNNDINATQTYSVANGGTGNSSFTLYTDDILCGGTTSTGALQPIVGAGGAINGYVLVSQGASALPIWQSNPLAAIIQVASTTITSTFSTSSTSFVDITGLSISITPTYSTSLVLVTYHVNGGNFEQFGAINLVRGSTSIFVGSAVGTAIQGTSLTVQNATNTQLSTSSMTYVDSPATTSATTYKLQAACNNNTFYINESTSGTGTSNGSFASTITVMEVSQ